MPGVRRSASSAISIYGLVADLILTIFDPSVMPDITTYTSMEEIFVLNQSRFKLTQTYNKIIQLSIFSTNTPK